MSSIHWRVIGGAALVVALIGVMVLLVQHDASGNAPSAERSIRDVLGEYDYLSGFALIYVEESGIPLFIAGDAFLVYVGHRLPSRLPVFIAAWLGFTLAVTLGASNLYLVARRYGRRLVKHRLAEFLHLTPRTLESAERWFARWGPWALIFGRHVPGLRVPLTVAAGVLLLPYRTFAFSLAVSSSAWAAAFLTVGAVFGDSVERAIRSQPLIYVSAAVGVFIVLLAAGGLRLVVGRAGRTPDGPPLVIDHTSLWEPLETDLLGTARNRPVISSSRVPGSSGLCIGPTPGGHLSAIHYADSAVQRPACRP